MKKTCRVHLKYYTPNVTDGKQDGVIQSLHLLQSLFVDKLVVCF